MAARAIDLDLLLKLRLVVARFGEMDIAKWWNTQGQLGRLGALAIRRGFPGTHRFARARSVFAVAGAVCAKAFDPPGCATLWRLPSSVEEAFDARWEHWIEAGETWEPFFAGLERLQEPDLTLAFDSLGLLEQPDRDALARLRRSAEGRAVPLPGTFNEDDATIRLLAVAFARGEPGALAVPYARLDG